MSLRGGEALWRFQSWPSSAGPTSANRRCSTGWPAGASPSSIRRAGVTRDRVVHARSRSAIALSSWWTPAASASRTSTTSPTQIERQIADGHRPGQRDPLRRRCPGRHRAPGRRGRAAAARRQQAGASCVANKCDTPKRRRRRPPSSTSSAGASRRVRQRPAEPRQGRAAGADRGTTACRERRTEARSDAAR